MNHQTQIHQIHGIRNQTNKCDEFENLEPHRF